jgi:hypothetical protein
VTFPQVRALVALRCRRTDDGSALTCGDVRDTPSDLLRRFPAVVVATGHYSTSCDMDVTLRARGPPDLWTTPSVITSGPGATTSPPAGTSTGWSPAVSTTLPPPEPARHGWAELLTLVGDLRRLAHDTTLEPDDALRRIRDPFADHDQGRVD